MGKLFQRSVNVGVASTVLLTPETNRKAIVLSPPSAGRYSVAFGEDAVLDSGITIMTGATPLVLYDDMCPGFLSSGINAVASGAVDVGVAQVLNP